MDTKRLVRGARERARSAAAAALYNPVLMTGAERYLSSGFRVNTELAWSSANPPEWFDHRADLYQFRQNRNPLWAERGVLSREPMFAGCRVLDMCCGDGFYSYHFFASTAAHVDAIDFDAPAIEQAHRLYALDNVSYAVSDIRTDEFPSPRYDVIVWDGAIEHFALAEMAHILDRCRRHLEPERGVLTGYTIVADPHGPSHPDHEHEFESAQELADVLLSVFPFVAVLENESPGRRNLYFRASSSAERLDAFRRFPPHEPATG